MVGLSVGLAIGLLVCWLLGLSVVGSLVVFVVVFVVVIFGVGGGRHPGLAGSFRIEQKVALQWNNGGEFLLYLVRPWRDRFARTSHLEIACLLLMRR